jgi:hypothetical protein
VSASHCSCWHCTLTRDIVKTRLHKRHLENLRRPIGFEVYINGQPMGRIAPPAPPAHRRPWWYG